MSSLFFSYNKNSITENQKGKIVALNYKNFLSKVFIWLSMMTQRSIEVFF
ncbi:hypothetical protein RV05_GL000293 [Enterococcus hirae]|nr:hypothetical protein RV05_GL000293 [Enterococcus hirae]